MHNYDKDETTLTENIPDTHKFIGYNQMVAKGCFVPNSKAGKRAFFGKMVGTDWRII
jgi:hypothetical protein